ncbi:MAG: VCBS repeat-containing protein, partial [Candidatus Poseidoniaceae archaeon]|nr:VCBS repeat-containing protein [Candidatus Poseidoniaceae archaeon]
MDDARRTGPFLLVLLLLFQTMAMIPAAANPTGGTVNTFSNGQAEASVALTAGTIDASLGIEVPRNVTFDSVSFVVNAKDETPTPGQVYIDIGQDGVKEWAFEGTGYGNLGHQQSFITGNTVDSVYSSGYVSSSMIHIPHGASIGSVDLDVNFTSAVAGGLVPTGIVEASTSGDMDNDTLPEIAVLSTTVTGFNAAISRIDWNASTGLNMSSWVATCAGATELSMADFNGDGMDDVVSFDYTSSNACVHFTNSTTASLGAAQLVVLNSNSIQASAGDFNQDGNADLISIHSGGIFSLRTFNAKVGSFGANQTYTVNMNNTATPTTLLYLTAGHFDANASTYSAVVTDFSGHSTPLQWTAGSGISDNPTHFDGIQSQPIAGDIDDDGDIDFLGTNQIGYTIALNTGSQWNTTDVLSTSELASASALNNASFFDHDGDGVTSLIVPRATGDCNVINPSLCGNLSIFDINSTSIGAQSGALQPWDAPMDADGVDMDGDGVLEHIVAAGNGTHGLFIGPYSTIGMDIDLDGQTDLSASGYSGSAQFAMDPLSIEDPMGNMTSILSPLMNALPYIEDGYGVRMSTTNFDFTSTTNGTFDLSNMDIGYDIDFIVENNPFSAGNLTN